MWRLRRPFHASWLIALSCLSVFGGIVLASYVELSFSSTLGWLLTGSLLCLIAWTRQQIWVIAFAITGGLIIGAWRGSCEQSALTAYDMIIGNEQTIMGTVVEDKDTDSKGNTTIRLSSIRIGEVAYPSQIWVSLASNPEIKRSDIVSIRGTLSEGFGTFAASVYRAELVKVQRPQPGDTALHVRDWFATSIRQAIPDPQSALGIGYLVGQRRSLPEELDTALKIAGLTHVVVASGYNLTILVRLARRLFQKISKYTALVTSSGLIAIFVAITGLSPSMSRAGFVAGLSLVAWYYGRSFHPLVLLPLAIAVTVLVNPSYAWGDVGWQLSFAAFAGVMLLAPLMQSYYFGDKKPGTVRQILGETIAATIMTLPILLYHFGVISNVSIFANLLILPLVPLAMLLTFIAGVGTLIVPGLAIIFGYPAYVLLSYMVQVAEYFAEINWASSEISIQAWQVALLYGCIISFMVYMQRKTKRDLADVNLVE